MVAKYRILFPVLLSLACLTVLSYLLSSSDYDKHYTQQTQSLAVNLIQQLQLVQQEQDQQQQQQQHQEQQQRLLVEQLIRQKQQGQHGQEQTEPELQREEQLESQQKQKLPAQPLAPIPTLVEQKQLEQKQRKLQKEQQRQQQQQYQQSQHYKQRALVVKLIKQQKQQEHKPNLSPIGATSASAIGATSKKTTFIGPTLHKSQAQRFLTIYPLDGSAGRLGNFCFRYAAALGIAKANDMTLLLPDTPLVREMKQSFQITASLETEFQGQPIQYTNMSEKRWGVFDSSYFQLPEVKNIRLTWVYSQSWRYFHKIEDQIKVELQLVETMKNKSATFVNAIKEEYGADYVVGMHVRRGDFLKESHQRWGYAVAPIDYFFNATQFYVKKYGRNIIFIVATDDRLWCQDNLNFNGARANFSTNSSPLEDMAILIACDHHIVSVGSFGWWAAWLGGGDVVYYKGFPSPGSSHATNHNPVDYYPANWIAF